MNLSIFVSASESRWSVLEGWNYSFLWMWKLIILEMPVQNGSTIFQSKLLECLINLNRHTYANVSLSFYRFWLLQMEKEEISDSFAKHCCPVLIAFLVLGDLKPFSLPPFHDRGSMKGLQWEAAHLATNSFKCILLPQHSFLSHSTTAALPDGPALTPPAFEMQIFFIYNPLWNI